MSEQSQDLLDKARKYVHSAELLRNEGDYDSAASRLYYAMFYCAEALLLTKGFTFSSHRAVISGFGQHLVKAGTLPAEMHLWLREAFDKRQVGDYTAVSLLEEADVKDLHLKAEKFIQQTEIFLQQAGFI